MQRVDRRAAHALDDQRRRLRPAHAGGHAAQAVAAVRARAPRKKRKRPRGARPLLHAGSARRERATGVALPRALRRRASWRRGWRCASCAARRAARSPLSKQQAQACRAVRRARARAGAPRPSASARASRRSSTRAAARAGFPSSEDVAPRDPSATWKRATARARSTSRSSPQLRSAHRPHRGRSRAA